MAGEGFDASEANGTNESDGFLRRIRVLRGALYGVGVWVLGFLLSAVAVTLGSTNALGERAESLSGEETFTLAGWVFYGAHNVAVELTRAGETVVSANVATDLGGASAATLVVVPVLLFLAGRKLGSGGWSWRAGSSMVVGYLPLTVLGVFLFSESGTAPLSNVTTAVGPATAVAYGVMGILYPVLIGGVGAYFAD